MGPRPIRDASSSCVSLSRFLNALKAALQISGDGEAAGCGTRSGTSDISWSLRTIAAQWQVMLRLYTGRSRFAVLGATAGLSSSVLVAAIEASSEAIQSSTSATADAAYRESALLGKPAVAPGVWSTACGGRLPVDMARRMVHWVASSTV